MFVELTNISHYFLEHFQFCQTRILVGMNQSYFFLFRTFFCFLSLRLAKDFQLFGNEPQLSDPQRYDLSFRTLGGGGGVILGKIRRVIMGKTPQFAYKLQFGLFPPSSLT